MQRLRPRRGVVPGGVRVSAAIPRGRAGASAAAIRVAMAANDPASAVDAARSESRALLEAICAAFPPASTTDTTWHDYGDACAVRDLLREVARLVVGE